MRVLALLFATLTIFLAGCSSNSPSVGMGSFRGQNLKIEVADSPANGGVLSWLKSDIYINDEKIAEIVWDSSLESGKRGSGVLADQFITKTVPYDGNSLQVIRVTDMTSIMSRPIIKYEFYIDESLIGVVVTPI